MGGIHMLMEWQLSGGLKLKMNHVGVYSKEPVDKSH